MIRATGRMLHAWFGGLVRRAPVAGWFGLAGLVLVVAVAALSPLGGYPVGADVDPAARSAGPSAAHWLGTDHLGRDVFWRTLLASRAFVGPGAVTCAVAAALGVPLGAAAGWRPGPASAAIRAALGALASVPAVVLVLLGCARFGAGPQQLALFAGAAAAPSVAEAVRARIDRLRHEDFVAAARAHGLSDLRILAVHLLLFACGRTIARKLLEAFASFVVLEAALSYLGAGFGLPEPQPSWGNMLAFEWGRDLSWALVAPAAALWATVWATVQAARWFAEVDADG